MKYRIKIDVGKNKKGDIVDVYFKELKEVGSDTILWFVLDGAKYGTCLPTEDNVKQKLIDRLFDEL